MYNQVGTESETLSKVLMDYYYHIKVCTMYSIYVINND